MNEHKNQKIFRMQPILCPWITSQPYYSSLWNKNRAAHHNDPTLTNRFLNNPWINRQMPLGIPRSQDKPLPSIQQSSSQFFYFLRLMQLFPDTHPATLHTVLVLCKNDFFCAVDKMLYAKRCKLLCYKKNLFQKSHHSRNNKSSGQSNNGNDVKTLNKVDCQKQNIQVNKVLFTNACPEKKKDDPTPGIYLQHEGPSNSFIINSFTEKAQDLSTSTLKQSMNEDQSQVLLN